MNFFSLVFTVIIAIASLVLGLVVLTRDPKSRMNQLFFCVALSITLWNTFSFLSIDLTSCNTIMARLNMSVVSLFFIFFYFFCIHFPTISNKVYPLLNTIIGSLGVIFALIGFSTDLLVQSVKVVDGSATLIMGSAGSIFYVFATVTTLIVLVTLYQKFSYMDKFNKAKVVYFLVGTFLFALFNLVFNVFLVYFSKENGMFSRFGDFSAIFFLGFTAYAIVKHQLFNIKVVATETIVILLSVGLLVEVFISNNSSAEGIVKSIIWLLASYGGWMLIRSVKNEIKQKEDLAKLTKELEKTNQHLKEVDKLKDDFLSMASHELNTPIAAIEGYLSMILDEKLAGDVNPKMEKYLKTVFQSSQRLAHLVKDLLNVSRIESNRIHIIWEQGQVEDIIEQSINEVMSKAKEAHHKLTFEQPKKSMPFTWYDKTRITEVILNFLGNSIKYTPDGGKIVVRCINDDQKIIVSVEDNGKGIPKDKGTRVFQKFSQVDVLKDEIKGTGLGMFISKRFVEMHGGKIWFKSDGEDKGTTFYFSLPIRNKKPFDPHDGEDAVLH